MKKAMINTPGARPQPKILRQGDLLSSTRRGNPRPTVRFRDRSKYSRKRKHARAADE